MIAVEVLFPLTLKVCEGFATEKYVDPCEVITEEQDGENATNVNVNKSCI